MTSIFTPLRLGWAGFMAQTYDSYNNLYFLIFTLELVVLNSFFSSESVKL